MSCYLCSDEHVSHLLDGVANITGTIYVKGVCYSINEATIRQKIGEILLRENNRSVNARYSKTRGRSKCPPYVYKKRKWETKNYVGGVPNAIETYKLIECLQYQSCDHNTWENSFSFRFLMACKERVMISIVENHSAVSDAYNNAPWSIG